MTGSVRVAFEGLTPAGVNWANVFWWNAPGSSMPSVAQCSSLAAAMYTAYSGTLLGEIGNDATLERAVVNWYGAQPAQVTGAHEASTAGGAGAATEVDSLSAVISWAIFATWRGGKPRTYIPCLPSTAFSSTNRLDPTFITALTTDAGSFIAAMNGISVTPFGAGVLALQSFFSGNVARTPPVMFALTSAQVHPRISSQRRRLGREVP